MCENKVVFTVERPDFITKNSSRIYEFMLQRKLCDVEIIAGNQKLYYHSNVLAAGSEYFKNLFFFESNNDPIKRVVINDEDPDSLQRVLQFFYTGKIEIEKENITKVLSVAGKLIAKSITEECCRIMINLIDVNNCLDLYESGISNLCEDLHNKTLDFIKMNFKEISETSKFLDLRLNLLIDLISSNNLDVSSEDVIFTAAKRWIMHDLIERKPDAFKIFEYIKLPLVSSQTLLGDMQTFCDADSECQNLFLQAIQYHTVPNNRNKLDPNLVTPRSPATTILVAGGWNSGVHNTGNFIPTEKIEIYDAANKKWVKFMETGIKRRGCALGLLRDELIFAGGDQDTVNTVESINLISKKKKSLPPMLERRIFAASITNDENFYVFGGCQSFPFNMKVLGTSEKYDSKINSWSYVTSMVTPRYACGGAKIGAEFFVIGGMTDQKATDVTEAYCFVTNKWRNCARMNRNRYGPGVTVFGGHIYAIGGGLDSSNNSSFNFRFFSLNTPLASVERYDPNTDTWTFIANISSTRYLAGAGVMAGSLHSIGGANGGTAWDTVETYDAKTNVWKKIESMVLAREFMGVFTVPIKYLDYL